jgi:hypothetical protein
LTIITNEKTVLPLPRKVLVPAFYQRENSRFIYLVDPKKIKFTALDTYDYAMQIRIKK